MITKAKYEAQQASNLIKYGTYDKRKYEEVLDDAKDFKELMEQTLRGMFGSKFQVYAERRKREIDEEGIEAHDAKIEARKKKILESLEKQDKAEYEQRRLQATGIGSKFYERTFNAFRANDEKGEKAQDACINIASGERKKGVILSGVNGIGKTHLAVAIVLHMTSIGKRANFKNIVDLISELKDSFKSGSELYLHSLLDCELLVLDDLGAEYSRNDSGWVSELIYKILNRAYEDKKIVVITTNLSDYELTNKYEPRIISRLRDMCEYITWGDKDHRGDFEPTDEATPFDRQEEMSV